jgi:phospholipase/lecithinase/hemolysin
LLRARRNNTLGVPLSTLRLTVVILVAAMVGAPAAGAVDFSGLYIFGNSLSDSGQFASSGLFPGTFTNPNALHLLWGGGNAVRNGADPVPAAANYTWRRDAGYATELCLGIGISLKL